MLYLKNIIGDTLVETGGRRVRCKHGEGRMDEKLTNKTLKQRTKVMVWASFDVNGGRKLKFLPAKVNAQVYQDVLKTSKLKKSQILLQDRAPCHTAKSTVSYLAHNKIETIYIPPNSPDMNPIENSFSILKSKLEKVDTSTVEKLKRQIRKQWYSIPNSYFTKLRKSMPSRLKEVCEKKGQMSSY